MYNTRHKKRGGFMSEAMMSQAVISSAVMNQAMIFTESAASKVWELIQEEENYNLKLRVYVTGGGCSGFQYGFTFDETINDDDTVVSRTIDADQKSQEILLLVDAMSFQYLVGSEIDYKEDVEGAQFIIRNPNAKTTCGCGSSFSAE
jgi:iron-sulfur cluster insertion protein